MLAERSNTRTSTSGAPLEKEKRESPPVIGRATMKARAARASIRKRRVNHLLSLEMREELFLAWRRKRVVAQA